MKSHQFLRALFLSGLLVAAMCMAYVAHRLESQMDVSVFQVLPEAGEIDPPRMENPTQFAVINAPSGAAANDALMDEIQAAAEVERLSAGKFRPELHTSSPHRAGSENLSDSKQ